jgi:hypothetical protein
LEAVPGTTRAAAPPGVPETLLPLTVGSSWTWQTNYNDMTARVVRQSTFTAPNGGGPLPCVVVETTQGESSEKVVQTEYFTLVDHQWEVLKRVYPGEDAVLTPPEVILKSPVVTGEHWTWDGQTASGQAHLNFEVMRAERIKVPALKLPVICQKVIMKGTDEHGSTITVTRWYAPGIGLAKEDSQMTRSQQSIYVHGLLKSFHLAAAGQATP